MKQEFYKLANEVDSSCEQLMQEEDRKSVV